MVGVDYAAEGLDLARGIWDGILQSPSPEADGTDEEVAASKRPIDFQILDILSLADPAASLPEWLSPEGVGDGGFDVVLDKGTFDAVSLSEAQDPVTGRKRGVDVYAAAAKRLMKRPGGRMVVTSCNWTEEEVRRWFEDGREEVEGTLVYEGRIEYRKFRFGGGEGSSVCTVVFLKI